jgi:Holliday junction resolvase
MNRYRKGADFERRVKADYERRRGFIAFRCAGSHGVADIIAGSNGDWHLVQCKTNGKLSKAERTALCAAATKAHATPILARNEKGKIVYETAWLPPYKQEEE